MMYGECIIPWLPYQTATVPLLPIVRESVCIYFKTRSILIALWKKMITCFSSLFLLSYIWSGSFSLQCIIVAKTVQKHRRQTENTHWCVVLRPFNPRWSVALLICTIRCETLQNVRRSISENFLSCNLIGLAKWHHSRQKAICIWSLWE